MPYDHTIPDFGLTIALSNKSKRMKNSVLNGVPFYSYISECMTKLFPSPIPTLRLPFIVLEKLDDEDGSPFHVTFAIPFVFRKDCSLMGRALVGM